MSRRRSSASFILRRVGGPSAAALLLMLAAFLPLRMTPARAEQPEALALIVSASTSITNLPSDVVRSAYQGLRVEYGGVTIVPFNLPPDSPVRTRMDRILLRLEPNQVGKFWVDQRIRDGRSAPRTVPTIDLLVRVVAQLKGAVAGVPVSKVGPGTRAVTIDGRRVSESGYFLAEK